VSGKLHCNCSEVSSIIKRECRRAWFKLIQAIIAQSDSDPGVYIRCNGMVEWNSGMVWNGGMLHRTYQSSNMCCTVKSTPSLDISEFVVVADRSTLSQLSLHTTCVYDIKKWQSFGPMDNRQIWKCLLSL